MQDEFLRLREENHILRWLLAEKDWTIASLCEPDPLSVGICKDRLYGE